MKTFLRLLILVLSPLAFAEQDALQYLYEPVLDENQRITAERLRIHARNAEFDAAIDLSESLLDDAASKEEVSPLHLGQTLINHGILYAAMTDYDLGLTLIDRGLNLLESSTNPFSLELFNGVMAKGICELHLGLLTEAEDTFRRAQHITHRHQGVYTEDQLPIVGYLTATHLRKREVLSADRQQLFSLRVAEQVHGTDSIELLPTLNKLGSYFATRGSTIPPIANSEIRIERDILFKNAITMYHRAVEIIETNYGENDLRLIPSLRGLANARLMQITSRRHAEAALRRTLDIVENNPNSDLTDRAQALTDLGDLYIITSDARAAETYLDAWTKLQEQPATKDLAASLFDSPVRLFPRSSPTSYLDRRPDSAAPGEELFAELRFDVSIDGKVREIEIIDKNVPNEQVRTLRQHLRASRYRPRIVEGELVPTEGLQLRQLFSVINLQQQDDARKTSASTAPTDEVDDAEEMDTDIPEETPEAAATLP